MKGKPRKYLALPRGGVRVLSSRREGRRRPIGKGRRNLPIKGRIKLYFRGERGAEKFRSVPVKKGGGWLSVREMKGSRWPKQRKARLSAPGGKKGMQRPTSERNARNGRQCGRSGEPDALYIDCGGAERATSSARKKFFNQEAKTAPLEQGRGAVVAVR